MAARQLGYIVLLAIIAGCADSRRSDDEDRYGFYVFREPQQIEVPSFCQIHRYWSWIFDEDYVPRCLTPFTYHHEQTRGELKWCSKSNGKAIERTMASARNFPYDCTRISECYPDTIIETTGRCDMTCEKALSTPIPIATYDCQNGCICPKGTYRNKKRECVTIDECDSVFRSCPPPKVYRGCGSRCPPTCGDPRRRKCKSCNPNLHCMCPTKLVQFSETNRTCLPYSSCPKCGVNAMFINCAPECPETCPGVSRKHDCFGCKENNHCMCLPGFVQLNHESVICVRREDCPMVCPAPRVSNGCGTCIATCDDPDPICTNECVPENQCACPDGYVELSDTNRTCVKKDECPVKCEGLKSPVECASACPATCDDREPKCDKKCIPNGCVCPEDHFQLSKDDATCVFNLHCPVKCDAPKVFVQCATYCPPTCQVPAPAFCSRACNPNVVCQCPPEMVQPDEDTLTCIKYADCPKTCEAPKVYEKCPSQCQPTCKEPNPEGECESSDCRVDHCVCPDGLVLHGDECIKPSQCPKKCDKPKIMGRVAPACQPTCRNPRPDPKTCYIGAETPEETCICPADMYLISENIHKCVSVKACQVYLKVKCEAPQVFSICPEGCGPTTCKNYGEITDACPNQCAEAGCVCPEGKILVSKSDPRCVQPDECPVKCQEPKKFKDCPTRCPATCDNRNPKGCVLGCAEDQCVCRKGFLLVSLEDRRCVTPNRCPEKQPACLPPKTFVECPSACPPTCDNPEPEKCTKDCGKDHCVCPDDTVLYSLEDKRCVKRYQCPIKCPEPKVYAPCASKCPATCAEPEPIFCSRACDANVVCVCPFGMVQLDKKNRTCMKYEDCPKCKAPKIFAECASKCRPTCQTPNPVFCDSQCDAGVECVCPPGMVNPKHDDDSCIPLADCPESCEFPLQATDCAPKCLATCEEPLPKCDTGCEEGIKCICPRGLLQLTADNATCVLPSQCPDLPKDCPIHKEPTRCATGCPATCANQRPRFCTKDCRPDVNCECPQGMVQRSLEDDTCVWPDDCEEP